MSIRMSAKEAIFCAICCRRYDAETEEALEDAYQGYLKRKGKREELEAAKAEAAQRVKRARLGKGSELSGVLGDHEGAASDEEGEEDNDGRRGRKRPAAPMFTTVPAEEEEVHTVQLAAASRSLSVLCPCVCLSLV